MSFCHLHNHSEHSLFDGFSKVTDIAAKVKSLGHNAVALTDHGSIAGSVKFYNECTKQGINPIVGCEIYLCEKYTDKTYYHLTVLCKNNTGWNNLVKINNIAQRNFYYRSKITFEDFFKHKEGLIVLSGCPAGPVPFHVRKGETTQAIHYFEQFLTQFGEDFYVEVMEHGLDFQKSMYDGMRELAIKYKIPIVATNDSHYTERKDALLQDYLICDNLKTTIYDKDRRIKMDGSEFYLKAKDEMKGFDDNELESSGSIADKCSIKFGFDKWLLPEIENKQEKFVELLQQGIVRHGLVGNEKYLSRLREEFKVIRDSNLDGYLLVVQDYVNHCKSKGILIGPGRGSVGGCLTAYLLGIHDIDPIKHGLLFSRFYNAGRSASLPDIDVDFPETALTTVKSYLKSKYGSDHVCSIGTHNTLKRKGAVKLVCRVEDVEYNTSNMYSEICEDEAKSYQQKLQDKTYSSVIDKAKEFEGHVVYSGVHAAGTVISPIALDDIVPTKIVDGEVVSVFDMHDLEQIGVVKYDILSLNTLDTIQDTLKQIDLKITDIPLDDKKTFDLINNTSNVGVFQLSSKGISQLANQMKVSSIDEIAAVVALYRPGPMASGLHTSYVRRKHGEEAVTYIHPSLEAVLGDTYGVMVYQEQIIKIAQVLAGFTEKEADNLRKAVGKKIMALMKTQAQQFKEGCLKNGIEEKYADQIWVQIVEFAEYCFNLSHSVGYAYITYYTAYLKANYPTEFMAALLNNTDSNKDKFAVYIEECKKMGIKLMPPSIKNGGKDFIAKENTVLFGFKHIKGLGDKTTAIFNRNYQSLEEFTSVTKPTKDTIIILAECGVFDEFGYNRNTIMQNAESIRSLKNRPSLLKTAQTITVFPELPEDDLAEKEFSRLSTYITYDPLKGKDLYTPDELDSDLLIDGFVCDVYTKITKNKKTIGILELYTRLGKIECLAFGRMVTKLEKIDKKDYVRVHGEYNDALILQQINKIG